MQNKSQKIGLFLLVLLITSAVDNVRNLPATAAAGTYIFYFFLIAVALFLLPVTLISAELSATHTSEKTEGIYGWVKQAFGPKMGMFAIWCQWINTLIWFPSILIFIANTAVFLIAPSLAQNKIFAASFIITTFWLMTIINLFGLRTSAKFASFCGMIGMIIPMGLIVLFALIWLLMGNTSHIQFTTNNVIPNLSSQGAWMGLTAIITSFLGLELATVHVSKVNNPKRNFPIALFISTIFMVATMLLGALAISMLFPQAKINVVNGTIMAFERFLNAYHIGLLFPILVIMILIGSMGSMVNWLISPAKGLLQAADDHFLPSSLKRRNQYDVPQNIMILQAVIVTLVCLALNFIPTVDGAYWLLTDLSTEIYVLMYFLMFLAAVRLKQTRRQTEQNDTFEMSRFLFFALCLMGIIGTILVMVIGFMPPRSHVDHESLRFIMNFSIGLVIALVPVIFFFGYRNQAKKQQS